MSLAENNPNESHKQGANNICQIVLNFVPLDNEYDTFQGKGGLNSVRLFCDFHI